jgi:hypothetical protein
MRRRTVRVIGAAVLVWVATPTEAQADAWDDDLRMQRAEAAARSSVTLANGTIAEALTELDVLPICRPSVGRCPEFVGELSADASQDALGVVSRSALQVAVEDRWTSRAVPRRHGGPEGTWTSTKARSAHKARRG